MRLVTDTGCPTEVLRAAHSLHEPRQRGDGAMLHGGHLARQAAPSGLRRAVRGTQHNRAPAKPTATPSVHFLKQAQV